MEASNWVSVISARFAPIVVATDEVAQLSIVILCCLLGFFFLRPIVANRRRSKVQQWNLQAREVNDSLYELHKPKGDPAIQLLFFHGLPFGESAEAHLSTWISADESCIWPKVWLAEEFPDAHILVVSYIEGLRKGSAENFDMHIISENLISDLMQANIGQAPHCPVVLVGHSFGGLVIKELCHHAHDTFKSSMNAAKIKKFLDSLRGVFYYSTPHHGSSDIGRARSVLSRPLFDYFITLSKDTSRLNSYFQNLCTCYPKWKIEGLGEMLPVTTGIFRGIVVVPEGSARDGVNFNLDSSADHFSVCRPEKKTSRRFNALTTLVSSVCDNSKEEKALAERAAIRENLERLPKQLVNMDVLVREVKSRLQKFTTLGLVGMGGLGKTTLARAVFNELGSAYEYSCFVPNIKLIKGDDAQGVKKIVWQYMHRLGKKVEDTEDWSALIGKTLLLVVDDINDDRDITLLSELADGTSPQSRFIITSRRMNLRKCLGEIYPVPFLDSKLAEELFLSHAFPNQAIVPLELAPAIRATVKKCGGLPLTLEVLGNYLALNEDDEFWKQTLEALEEAGAVEDLEERLWATLRVSYDGLNEVAKEMFLDATTFFSESEDNGKQELSLRMAKAAWRQAYGTKFETLLWQTLVDKSLVYHVEENDSIKVHDQLLSLGRKIAFERNSGRCRVWDETMASKLLENKKELADQDIFALRLSKYWDTSPSEEIHISSHTHHKLKKLQYLEVDAQVLLDGGVEEISFPSKLALLKCVGRLDTFNCALQDRLMVLHLDCVEVLPRSIGQLSALRIFIGSNLESVPDEFGNLSQLEHLEFIYCHMESLPATFYKLSQLNYLKFNRCRILHMLPENFGALSKLKDLEFDRCSELRSLPETFGGLSALDRLVVIGCTGLLSLSNSFGSLSALKHLEIRDCYQLQGLPDSFGNLSALKHLEISTCGRLRTFPDFFGNLSALKYLEISDCLESHFPDSFRNMEALEVLKLAKHPFETVPKSFGKLSKLRHLELTDCGPNILSVIPFSELTQLQNLEIIGRTNLIPIKKLPKSLAELTALTHLVLSGLSIRSIPDFMKGMQSLRTLELSALPYVKEVPTWLGHAGAAPLASSRKIFEVQDKGFSLVREESEIKNTEWLITSIYKSAMEKVSEYDYEGALADMCPANLEVVESRSQRFLLQERGIVRCKAGDLQGALKDLTAASEVLSDHAEFHEKRSLYECWRYRGCVNFLLGDLGSANDDGANALRLLRTGGRFKASGFGKETITYMDFRLAGETERNEHWNQLRSAESEMMGKVKVSDFQGALASWCDFEAKVYSPYVRVYFLKERGILKRIAGDLDGALEDLTGALEIVGDNYELLKHRGYVKYLMGDDSGARKDGERCMAMDPLVDPNCLGGLSVAFLEFRLNGSVQCEENLWSFSHEKVMEKVKEKEFLGALAIWDDFDARVGGYHHRVCFLQERGLLKRMAGDLDGALEDLTAAIEIDDDDNYELLKNRGYVKYMMGDDSGARKDAERCMAMDPVVDGPDCLGGLPVAFLEFRLKGREECEENLRSISHEKVMEKVKEKEFLGALAIWDDFNTRVCGDNDRVFFLQERGILKQMAGDPHGALEDLTAALEIDDDDYELLKHRGYVKYLMGDEGGARKDAERCMAMDPVVQLPLAFLEFRLKGWDQLEESFFTLSKVREKVKEKEFLGALAIWDDFDARVCDYNDRVFFLKVRGILQRMAGNLHGALEDLTVALEMSGDDNECLKHRGYVKFLLGDIDGAQTDTERCLALGLKIRFERRLLLFGRVSCSFSGV